MALESISGQFTGLDMKQLIGAPLSAACDANLNMAQTTANFINTVGFNEDGSTRTADFQYTKKDVNEDGTIISKEMGIDVPMLAIVPIPNLQVDDVNILFDMEVKSSERHEDTNDKSGTLSATGRIGWGPFSLNATVTGTISAHQSNTRASDNSAKYHVDVRAANHGIPEGLARVLDMMASSLSPSVTSQAPVDASGNALSSEDQKQFDALKASREQLRRLEESSRMYLDDYAARINYCKSQITCVYIPKAQQQYNSLVSTITDTVQKQQFENTFATVISSLNNFYATIDEQIRSLSPFKDKDTIIDPIFVSVFEMPSTVDAEYSKGADTCIATRLKTHVGIACSLMQDYDATQNKIMDIKTEITDTKKLKVEDVNQQVPPSSIAGPCA